MSNNTQRSQRSPRTNLVPTDFLAVDQDFTYDFGSAIEREGEPATIPLIRFTLADTYEEKGSVWTRLTVAKLGSGTEPMFPPVLGPIRVNLMNHTRAGWGGMQESLDELLPEFNWDLMLGVVKARTMQGLDEPVKRVNLGEAAGQNKARAPYLLKPFIASSGVSVLYGDGGTGKSVLAVAMALEVSTGAVLISDRRAFKTGAVIYADYEDEHDEHANRLAAMCRGNGVELDETEIYHLALVGKVATEAKRLRQVVYDTKAQLVILDSVGMGRGGDALGAEDTIRMFRSLRGLGAPVLAIDHVSKEAKKSKGKPDPYGSIYTRNSSRMAWHVEQRAPLLGDPWEYLVFQHTKANHVKKQAPRYIKVRYLNAMQEIDDGEDVDMIHSIAFEITDLAGLPDADQATAEREGTQHITLTDEIVAAIFAADRAMTAVELAEQLGRGDGTIRKACHRAVDNGILLNTGEGFTIAEDPEKPIPF